MWVSADNKPVYSDTYTCLGLLQRSNSQNPGLKTWMEALALNKNCPDEPVYYSIVSVVKLGPIVQEFFHVENIQ